MKFYIGLIMTALLVTGCSKNPPDCNDSDAKELAISIIKNKLTQPFYYYETVYGKGLLKEMVREPNNKGSAISFMNAIGNSKAMKNNTVEEDEKIGLYKFRLNLAEYMDFDIKQVKLVGIDEKIGRKVCNARLEAKISDKALDKIEESLENQLQEIKYYVDMDYVKGTEDSMINADEWEKSHSFALMYMEKSKENMIASLRKYQETPWSSDIRYDIEKMNEDDFDVTVSYK